MLSEESLDHSQLIALTPLQYLRDGFRDEAGNLRPQLRGVYATAAAIQLEAFEVAPQELAATLEALQQVLPLHQGIANQRFATAKYEALELVSMMYRKSNNFGIVQWLEQCSTAIKTEDDISAFIEHFVALVRQYSLIIALKIS
jgi:hypothetical protein